MRGPKKDTVKLSEQGVVTEEALIAYLNNKLSPEEKQQLEKLLLEDPFAQDALEGLQSSASQATVTTSLSSLNKKVRARSGLKERKKLQIHWVNYVWAAVVFGLLIGIGFIMVNSLCKKDHNLAVNDKKESTSAVAQTDSEAVSKKPQLITADSLAAGKLPLSDTVVMPAVSKSKLKEEKKDNAGELKGNTDNQKAASTTAMQATTAANQSKADKKQAGENKSAALKTNAKTDSIKTAGYSADKNAIVAKAETLKKESKPEIKDPAILQDEAMKSFNSGDYATAAEAFDKILKHDPENPDALYFGGISDYINGKTTKSENNFDKLLKKRSKYQEGSKWYKANILIKKGKSEAAKALLQDLTNSNGSYKERAIKKLAEIGF